MEQLCFHLLDYSKSVRFSPPPQKKKATTKPNKPKHQTQKTIWKKYA